MCDDDRAICLDFLLDASVTSEAITFASLTLHFQRWWSFSQTARALTLQDATPSTHAAQPMLYDIEHKLHTYNKWVTVDVTPSAKLWGEVSISLARFKLACPNCEWNELLRLRNGLSRRGPHLELHLEGRGRGKRSALRCSSQATECCVQDLYVSFSEIGWDWVIDPAGYSPNMCQGDCSSEFYYLVLMYIS